MKKEGESFFWTSYSDLMTSLFFIMLVLFVLTVISLRHTIKVVEEGRRASEEQLAKINEIEEAVNNIDTTWFDYKKEYKKHVLKIDVEFNLESSTITDISPDKLEQLYEAGESIVKFLNEAHSKYGVQYLLIVEGQASRDNYKYNNELSYSRALSLVQFWKSKNLEFDSNCCELIISGSGQDGTLRVQPDDKYNKANQRFLIHIVPKPGIIEASKKKKEIR